MMVFDKGRDHVMALFRIVFGFLFLCHGASRLFGLFGARAAEFGAWPSWWASLIQVVGGVLVTIGVATRPAAVLCSGSMAFAYFTVHQGGGLLPIENGGEAAALFCWGFLLIAFADRGRWSVAGVFRRAPAQVETAA
ncbi:DoxX family protein [Amycolatopsis sp. NPDC088138]|uniref:DoxX family protein n=1 Tax=Amycolatopsis sp. NPDC088138 TaxID=3363938 RepID=UPI00382349D1